MDGCWNRGVEKKKKKSPTNSSRIKQKPLLLFLRSTTRWHDQPHIRRESERKSLFSLVGLFVCLLGWFFKKSIPKIQERSLILKQIMYGRERQVYSKQIKKERIVRNYERILS